ncbi:MAG: hypothetical protein U0R66_12180 [Mycobacterium sp.]
MGGSETGTVTAVVAGLGGLVLGHMVWLLAISMATATSSPSTWLLVVAVLVLAAGAGIGRLAWQRYQRKEWVPAAFLGALPVLPVIFTLIALGETYL